MTPTKALREQGDFTRSAEKHGRAADLQTELEGLLDSRNRSRRIDATSIPATFLRVTVAP